MYRGALHSLTIRSYLKAIVKLVKSHSICYDAINHNIMALSISGEEKYEPSTRFCSFFLYYGCQTRTQDGDIKKRIYVVTHILGELQAVHRMALYQIRQWREGVHQATTQSAKTD